MATATDIPRREASQARAADVIAKNACASAALRRPCESAPAITLCIVNHDGEEHLRHALRAVFAQPWRFAEVLLVDNASRDDSIAVACALCPGMRVLRLPSNRGPGAARNVGFRAARHHLILFQDNDVRLQENTVAALAKRLRTAPDVLAVAPRVLYADDPATVQFDSADCHFLGLMATRHADAPVRDLDDEAAPTTSLVTACFLIDRTRWSGGELFDETLGFNLEDHDFGVRARVAGHALWIEPKARVMHGSGTPGLSYRPGRQPSEQRLYFLTLNRWIVMTKCYSRKTLWLLAPALLAFELLQFVWLASQGRARVWVRAFRAYWACRARLAALRAQVQSARKLPDGAILREAALPLTRANRESLAGRWLAPFADRAFRGYWRVVRYWVRGA